MRHQAITSWKQQAGGNCAYSRSGNFFLADGIAGFTIQANILMLQADVIL
ncbi:MAG TPA: hypothetical protein VGO55_08410 [Allosphingosinicella sp.]|nr:hypothetical protein [Allosphingosinicella sp.]